MKNLRLASFGLALFSIGFFYSCAPRYGAHFQKSRDEGRFYSPAPATQVPAAPQRALVHAAPGLMSGKSPIQQADKILMDKLIDLEMNTSREKNTRVTGEVQRKEVQRKKEKLVLEAVRTKLDRMSAMERKAFTDEVKQLAKTNHKNRTNPASFSPTSTQEVSESTLLLVLITILVPPLGVYLYEEEINEKFWIALVLTLLFYVPGLIYSLIVILD